MDVARGRHVRLVVARARRDRERLRRRGRSLSRGRARRRRGARARTSCCCRASRTRSPNGTRAEMQRRGARRARRRSSTAATCSGGGSARPAAAERLARRRLMARVRVRDRRPGARRPARAVGEDRRGVREPGRDRVAAGAAPVVAARPEDRGRSCRSKPRGSRARRVLTRVGWVLLVRDALPRSSPRRHRAWARRSRRSRVLGVRCLRRARGRRRLPLDRREPSRPTRARSCSRACTARFARAVDEQYGR